MVICWGNGRIHDDSSVENQVDIMDVNRATTLNTSTDTRYPLLIGQPTTWTTEKCMALNLC